MTLKENSKGYVFFLVSMVLYGAYSLILTIISVIDNAAIPYVGSTYVFNIINAISGRLPIVILCIMFIRAGNKIYKCLDALSVYFALCILSVLLVFVSKLIGLRTVGDFGILSSRFIIILLNVLAIFGIKMIKDSGQTLFFKIVWLITIIYNLYTEISYTVATARVFLAYSYTGYEGLFVTTLLTAVFYTIFNISIYIFVRSIDTANEASGAAEYGEVNIAKAVLLSIITFGIYQWIWLYRIIKNVKFMNDENGSPTAELLCLMFVPLYWIFWMYKRGKSIKEIADKRQIPMSDNSALYLILGLLGFGTLQIAIVQNDLNTVIRCEKTV